MYPPNLKFVALPVPGIKGGSQVPNPHFGKGRPYRGSGMVPFERALVSSYKSSISQDLVAGGAQPDFPYAFFHSFSILLFPHILPSPIYVPSRPPFALSFFSEIPPLP